MHCAVAFIAVGVFALSHAAPLDLGAGGVFKGAEAQSYFATRFGSDFFTRLAAVMAKSGSTSSAASPRKSSTSVHAPKAKKEDRPELKFETKHSASEPVAAGEGEGKVAVRLPSAGPAIASAVAVSDSLYRDAVAPRTTKGASDYKEQETNNL